MVFHIVCKLVKTLVISLILVAFLKSLQYELQEDWEWHKSVFYKTGKLNKLRLIGSETVIFQALFCVQISESNPKINAQIFRLGSGVYSSVM